MKPRMIVRYGLENVVALDSSICFIDGEKGILLYRGYDIEELVEKSSFEEVAWLLLKGELPTKEELSKFETELSSLRKPEEVVFKALDALPRSVSTIDALRTGASVLGAISKEGPEASAKKAIACFPTICASFYRFKQGLQILPPHPNLSTAANFLAMLGKALDEEESSLFDKCLIIYAEHELNASAFSARITASTLSDYWSSITSAIGTLKGPLHGGANARVIGMLREIGSPEKVSSWIEEKLKAKQRIMGIGHRVYKKKDPRANILKSYAKSLQKRASEPELLEIAIEIEKEMWARKKLPANVDFYMAIVLHWLGIPEELFPCVFAIARTAGWSSHILEQYGANRLIRPRARYVGNEKRGLT